jgi:hypothetical protein
VQGLGKQTTKKEPAKRVFRKMPEANFLPQFLSIAATLCDDETKALIFSLGKLYDAIEPPRERFGRGS